MSRKTLVVSAAIALVAGLFSSRPGAQAPVGASQEFVGNEVLVQFRGDATAFDRQRARAQVNGARLEVVIPANRHNDGRGDLELMRIAPGLAVAAAVRDLESDSAVEFA